ncbi:hypothetical protein D9619_006006 [Psilocybe cf. subviscida]|uniref:EamA domain-containing protein n=1 Tax=Psilocybe cf. subviscida TaxID=2480587 RepID=A0A8H5BWE3_9AGAR|nr:hypothetical protein D9619_006006 [Psilocybe cf. subviscida]
MPSSLYVPFLLGGMLLTGSSNSLWSKWQDMQCVENCADPDPRNHVLYEQPVWQTLQMFVGEMLCFLPVIYAIALARYRKYTASKQIALPDEQSELLQEGHAHGATSNGSGVDDEVTSTATTIPLHGKYVLLMWIPAFCDLTATTLMNVGLLYTPVSIFQMTRGALVLFVGTFSVIFLKRKLWLYQWVSLLIVIAGVGLVGWSGSLVKDVVKTEVVRRVFNITNARQEAEVGKVLVGALVSLFNFYVLFLFLVLLVSILLGDSFRPFICDAGCALPLLLAYVCAVVL